MHTDPELYYRCAQIQMCIEHIMIIRHTVDLLNLGTVGAYVNRFSCGNYCSKGNSLDHVLT